MWAYRGFPGVANLASNCEYPNPFSLQDTATFVIFQLFSENSN